MTKRSIFSKNLPSAQVLKQQIAEGKYVYLDFVQKANLRAKNLLLQNPNLYVESHHIIPKHAGGLDSPENLVILTYEDHIIAHYIRWIATNNPNDKLAYLVMSGQCSDVRKERAKLGGKIGGPITQKFLKENQKGWYDSEGQSKRGKKAAEVNSRNQTGAWDPKNLEILAKGRETIKNNLDVYMEQKSQNLKKGRQTQKEKGINLGNNEAQRLKSLMKNGVVLDGKKYSIDKEQYMYLCETTLDYYIKYAPKRPTRKKKEK